jgi:hypothetical protein
MYGLQDKWIEVQGKTLNSLEWVPIARRPAQYKKTPRDGSKWWHRFAGPIYSLEFQNDADSLYMQKVYDEIKAHPEYVGARLVGVWPCDPDNYTDKPRTILAEAEKTPEYICMVDK